MSFGRPGASVNYNRGTNTVVRFTGNNPIKSTYTFNYAGSGNGKPHFGLDPSSSTGGGPAFTVVSQYWSNKTAKAQLPSLSVKQPALVGTNFKHALFFADATSNGQTDGQWFKISYTTHAGAESCGAVRPAGAWNARPSCGRADRRQNAAPPPRDGR